MGEEGMKTNIEKAFTSQEILSLIEAISDEDATFRSLLIQEIEATLNDAEAILLAS